MSRELEHKETNLSIVSYSLTKFLMNTLSIFISVFFFIFWETEVKLNVWLITIAYTIFSVWNAVNNPIIGYIADRPKKFWKRYGKRFPWVMGSGIPAIFLLVAIFSPPNVDPISGQLILFFWVVTFLCLYELAFTAFSLNHWALFPDKFRMDSDRRNVGTLGRAFLLVGTAVGSIVPPLFITYGDRQSYTRMAWILAVVCLILFIAIIPGHIESKEMKERYLEMDVDKEKVSFFQAFKIVLSSKNFVVVIVLFFMDGIVAGCLLGSLQYVTKYILQEEASSSIFLMAGFIIGSLGSMYFWLRLSHKLNNHRKMLIYGAFISTILLLPFMFVQNLVGFTLATLAYGIGGAAIRVGIDPVFADTIDEAIVKSGKRMEGTFMGLRSFFLSLNSIVIALIIAISHELTGFDPNAESQTPLALFGIRVQAALFPMFLNLLALLVFIFIYDLTPEKTRELKSKIKELNL